MFRISTRLVVSLLFTCFVVGAGVGVISSQPQPVQAQMSLEDFVEQISVGDSIAQFFQSILNIFNPESASNDPGRVVTQSDDCPLDPGYIICSTSLYCTSWPGEELDQFECVGDSMVCCRSTQITPTHTPVPPVDPCVFTDPRVAEAVCALEGRQHTSADCDLGRYRCSGSAPPPAPNCGTGYCVSPNSCISGQCATPTPTPWPDDQCPINDLDYACRTDSPTGWQYQSGLSCDDGDCYKWVSAVPNNLFCKRAGQCVSGMCNTSLQRCVGNTPTPTPTPTITPTRTLTPTPTLVPPCVNGSYKYSCVNASRIREEKCVVGEWSLQNSSFATCSNESVCNRGPSQYSSSQMTETVKSALCQSNAGTATPTPTLTATPTRNPTPSSVATSTPTRTPTPTPPPSQCVLWCFNIFCPEGYACSGAGCTGDYQKCNPIVTNTPTPTPNCGSINCSPPDTCIRVGSIPVCATPTPTPRGDCPLQYDCVTAAACASDGQVVPGKYCTGSNVCCNFGPTLTPTPTLSPTPIPTLPALPTATKTPTPTHTPTPALPNCAAKSDGSFCGNDGPGNPCGTGYTVDRNTDCRANGGTQVCCVKAAAGTSCAWCAFSGTEPSGYTRNPSGDPWCDGGKICYAAPTGGGSGCPWKKNCKGWSASGNLTCDETVSCSSGNPCSSHASSDCFDCFEDCDDGGGGGGGGGGGSVSTYGVRTTVYKDGQYIPAQQRNYRIDVTDGKYSLHHCDNDTYCYLDTGKWSPQTQITMTLSGIPEGYKCASWEHKKLNDDCSQSAILRQGANTCTATIPIEASTCSDVSNRVYFRLTPICNPPMNLSFNEWANTKFAPYMFFSMGNITDVDMNCDGSVNWLDYELRRTRAMN